jgi:membrane protease YdiL (CAAX protease family)
MRPLRSLAVYLLVILVGGALLAPWLYLAAQAAAKNFSSLQKLAQSPFHRFVHRSMLILAVAGLWPFLLSLNMRQPASLGLQNPFRHWSKLISGFLFGFVSLACLALFIILAGARKINFAHTGAEIVRDCFKSLGTAAIVAVLEEILFRGALLGALRRARPWTYALLISSAVYALVHFFSQPQSPKEIDWSSGFVVLGQMLSGFTDWQRLLPGFFNLTLAGILLGLAFLRTGTLFCSIGIHAGWIFWLKFFSYVTAPVAGASAWWWGTEKLIDGWMALLILSLSLVGLRQVWPQETASNDAQ